MPELSSSSRRDSLIFWIYRAHMEGTAVLRRSFQEAGFDVTPEQFGVLAAVVEQEGLNQSIIGERTYKDRHNITRILNHLQKKGCIERRPDGGDKRIYRIYPTKEGSRIYDGLVPLVVDYFNRSLAGINEKAKATMRKNLEHVVENIEKMR